MNMVFLSYDDPKGSTFFYQCALDLKKNIALNHQHNLTCVDTINDLAKNPDIKYYCVYSHGNNTGIYDQNSNPIITLEDSKHYANSIFYTMACKTANELGVHMHRYKCDLYYGFVDNSKYVDDADPLLQKYFIDTHNYPFLLLKAGEPIEGIINKIESYYEEKMEEIRHVYPFARGWLRDNLDRIVIYYNSKTYRRE